LVDPTEIAVVYADDTLLVLNKPSGLLSVPGRGPDKQDCLSARVRSYYPDALVVHRLDMATSGLLVMARGEAVQRHLSHAFANHQIHKRYEAMVDGLALSPESSLGEGWHDINLPIFLNWNDRPKRVIDLNQGQPSITRWRLLSANTATHTSRLALVPVTGRTHQLRVHMLAIGHPILGDALYAPPSVRAKSGRLLLHATQLELPHPLSLQPLCFHSPAAF